jgi:hypothetical protein
MKKKIVLSTAAAFLISGVLGPPSPDPFSSLVLGVEAAFLCAIPLLILSRLNVMKSASKSVHTLVCVLVCMVAVLSAECFLLMMVVKHRHEVDSHALVLNQDRRVASTGLSTAEERSLPLTHVPGYRPQPGKKRTE